MKLTDNCNISSLIIVIFLITITFPGTIFSQYKKETRSDRLYKAKSFNQIQSTIMKADRYEFVSDFGKSYNLYRSLMRTNSKEPKVLNGYVRNSVKTKKIKECEIKLKSLISTCQKDNKGNIDLLEILLESFLGQLFLMTSRDMQGNEIIKLINASNISSELKYAMKGRMYHEASSFKNAIEQYTQARKELNEEDIFSEELFNSYSLSNMITEATNELVNVFLKEDESRDREKRFDIFSAKHEMIKLFELEENRDTIIKAIADRSKKNKSLNNLLSELYFMNKDYDNAFSVLKRSNIDKDEFSVIITFATKLLKENDYQNSANFYSLYFTENKQIQKKELKQFFLYIDALVKLNRLESSINKLSDIEFPEAKIKLAYIHHLSGNWKESKNIYEKQFDRLKTSPNEYIDYIKLLISLKDYSESRKLLNNVKDNRAYHLIKSKVYDQIIYLDSLLSLLELNKEEFLVKYKAITEDMIISDSDNNLIEIKKDLETIKDDEKLLNSYLDYLSYQIDPTNKYEVTPPKAENVEDKAKKIFVLKLNYYYLKAAKNNQAQNKLVRSILSEDPIGSEIGSLILNYCDGNKVTEEERNEILMELLKGEFSDFIKSKARRIIRQKQP